MKAYWEKVYRLHGQLPEHRRRVAEHKQVIARFIELCDRPYLSFSGGKDSSAMLVLFAEMGLQHIPVFTQADDFDWPYKKDLCHSIIKALGFHTYHYIESKVSVLELLKQNAETISMQQCWENLVADFVKQHQYNGFCMGIRFEESVGRRLTLAISYRDGLVRKCKDGLVHGYPMAFLTGKDVFAIIQKAGIPYAEIYDRHEELTPHQMRFSWMFKPGITHNKGGLSWLKKNYPEQFQKLVKINPAVWSMI